MNRWQLPHGKGPWRITFDTNPDLCNLRCMMCEEHSFYRKTKRANKRIMDISIIQQVVEDSVPFGLKEIIPSTMGEPLLYPEFDQFIQLARDHDVKINLTTNGTFPRRGVDEWGRQILPAASDVKISISGATKETAEGIMRGIEFEQQLSDIERFLELRDDVREAGENHPTVTFQITYMEKNFQELPQLLKIAVEMGADRFKGHHLWVTWPELEQESLRRSPEAIERWNTMVDRLHHIAGIHHLPGGNKIQLDNVYKIAAVSRGRIVPDHWKCPFLGREAWVAWDGNFNVCCSPDNLRRTLGCFGNVKETPFMELWNGEQYFNLVGMWGGYDVCKKCNMRKPEEDMKEC